MHQLSNFCLAGSWVEMRFMSKLYTCQLRVVLQMLLLPYAFERQYLKREMTLCNLTGSLSSLISVIRSVFISPEGSHSLI